MKRAVTALCALILVFAILTVTQLGLIGNNNVTDTSDDSGEYYNDNESSGDDDMERTSAPLINVDTDPESYTVLVNREYPMSQDYVPSDLTVPDVSFSFYGTCEKSYMRQVAADAIEELFDAALKESYTLKVVSAYRSYERQEEIYNNNVSSRGEALTDKVSAKSGCSEHQTGLAIDISSDSVGCTIEESFGSSDEGKWIAKNCYKYGFIIRYPKGKSDITGYSYEPWHIRYVGVNLAKYLHKNELTLEEYYQTTTVDEKVPEDEQIMDTDTSDEEQMTTAPTPRSTNYIKYSTSTASPSSSATPSPSKKPKSTKNPKSTKKPSATSKSSATNKPSATKKPAATKGPVETSKPDVTKKPESTPEPVATESIDE